MPGEDARLLFDAAPADPHAPLRLRALAPDSGAVVWESGCASHLYLGCAGDRIYVLDLDDRVHVLDLGSGREIRVLPNRVVLHRSAGANRERREPSSRLAQTRELVMRRGRVRVGPDGNVLVVGPRLMTLWDRDGEAVWRSACEGTDSRVVWAADCILVSRSETLTERSGRCIRVAGCVSRLEVYCAATGRRLWEREAKSGPAGPRNSRESSHLLGAGASRFGVHVLRRTEGMGVTYALVSSDRVSGQERWTRSTFGVEEAFWPPPQDERHVYLFGHVDMTSAEHLRAVSLATGETAWELRSELVRPVGVDETGGRFFVLEAERERPGGFARTWWATALDSMTGEVLWRFALAGRAGPDLQVGAQTLYVYRPSGKYGRNGSVAAHPLVLGGPIPSSPLRPVPPGEQVDARDPLGVYPEETREVMRTIQRFWHSFLIEDGAALAECVDAEVLRALKGDAAEPMASSPPAFPIAPDDGLPFYRIEVEGERALVAARVDGGLRFALERREGIWRIVGLGVTGPEPPAC